MTVARSEASPGGPLPQEPGVKLTRKELLEFSALCGAGLAIPESLAKNFSPESRPFWDAVDRVRELDIDPKSIVFIQRLNEKTGEIYKHQICFLSRKDTLLTEDEKNISPTPTCARVSVDFDTEKQAQEFGSFLMGVTTHHSSFNEIAMVIPAVALVGGISGKKLTRREFIKYSLLGGTLATLISACTSKPGEKPTLSPTVAATLDKITPQVNATPTPEVKITAEPIPKDFAGVTLNTNYLVAQGKVLTSYISTKDPKFAPQPTAVAPQEALKPKGPPNETPLDYASKVFYKSLDLTSAVDVLKYAVAQGPQQGTDGSVTYFSSGLSKDAAFAGLPIYREALQPSTEELYSSTASPRELVLKKGAGITILGRASDGRVVIAFEEYPEDRRTGKNDAVNPKIRLATITPAYLKTIAGENGSLKNLTYDDTNPGSLSFKDKKTGTVRTVVLNQISNDLYAEILKETGFYWVDKYIDKYDGTDPHFALFPNPVVPTPDTKLLPPGVQKPEELTYKLIYNNKDLNNPGGVMVWAKDKSGNPVLVARYNKEKKNWIWRVPNIQDHADIYGLSFVAAANPQHEKPRDEILFQNFRAIKPLVFSMEWVCNKGEGNYENLYLADQWVSAAENRSQSIIATPLSWHNSVFLPKWFNEQSYSEDQAREVMKRHISKIVTQYNSKIKEFVVLQETVWFNGSNWGYERSPWYRTNANSAIPKYISEFYTTARQAGNDAILSYSDYGIGLGGIKSDKVYAVVENLRKQTIGSRPLIDKVIFEEQWDGDVPLNENAKKKILAQIARYKAIGVSVGIEFDVTFKNTSSLTKDQRLARAKEIYQQMIELVKSSGWCNELTIWNPVREGSYAYPGSDVYAPFSDEPNNSTDDELLAVIKSTLPVS